MKRMDWTCGPCTDKDHDHCLITEPDSFRRVNEALGLPNDDKVCSCSHVYTAALADILGPIICDTWEPESLLHYSDQLATGLPEPSRDDTVTMAHRVAGLVIRKVVRNRLTDGALSS